MRELQAEVHKLAKSRLGATLDDWIELLDNADIPRVSGGDGSSPSAQQKAVSLLVESERARHATHLDILTPYLLADDIGEVDVPDLLGKFDVEIDSDGLSHNERTQGLDTLAQDWSRFILVGLPGGGKSTALRQIAAVWAEDLSAPFPILINLKQMGDLCRDRGEFDIHDLVAAGLRTRSIDPTIERMAIDHLVQQFKIGNAAFLLDGLDECGESLGTVLRCLQSEVVQQEGGPVIVASRKSAADMARRFNLPPVRLKSPKDLRGTLSILIAASASARVPSSERESWTEARERWLRERFESRNDIWSVPMLASMMTLLACQDIPLDKLPSTRTGLLKKAIDQSCVIWERKRDPELQDSMREFGTTWKHIERGFVHIGHTIGAGRSRPADVRNALAKALEEEFDLTVIAASGIAEEVEKFWDDRVGVFCLNYATNRIESRSQVLVDIADAQWLHDQSGEEQKANWLDRAIAHDPRGESLALALELDSDVLRLAIERTDLVNQPELLLLIMNILKTNNDVPIQLRARLLTRLSSSIGSMQPSVTLTGRPDIPTGRMPEWRIFIEVAQLLIPPEVRSRRDEMFTGLEGEQLLIVHALCICADARFDGTSAREADEKTVLECLDLPLPDDDEPALIETSRNTFAMNLDRETLVEGRGEVALGAARVLRSMDSDLARTIAHTARCCPINLAEKIQGELYRRGYASIVNEMFRGTIGTIRGLGQIGEYEQTWYRMRDAIAAIGDSTELVERKDRRFIQWKLQDLSDLSNLMRFGRFVASESRSITAESDTFREILRLYCVGAQIDTNEVAHQAKLSVELNRYFVLGLLYTPPPPFRNTELSESFFIRQRMDFLVDTFISAYAIYSRLAFDLMVQLGGTEASEMVLRKLDEVPSKRRERAGVLVLMHAAEAAQTSKDWLSGNDYPLRMAAALWVSHYDTDRKALWPLATDADDSLRKGIEDCLDLRLRSDAAKLPPSYWTCETCFERNSMQTRDCELCDSGSHHPTSDSWTSPE